ncbi:MAG: adenylate/guanylate cyclase domain-containing protein [Firmicutes bacterium]|nr:adenylate/guanylate cyclase domain-containing protein [Bacillota bacterium]
MKNRKKGNQWKRTLFAALAACIITVIALSGVLGRPDRWLEDVLFQRPEAVSGEVVVIGIDEKALEVFGPYNTWDRTIMAKALRMLNSDSAKKPAVVAIDTLYSGETDPVADAELAQAAAELGNVITAASAEFGENLIRAENGGYTLDSYALLGFEESYPALKEVTGQGHINAMYDTDGIMRHAVLYIDLEDEKRVYSMAEQAAEAYLQATGGELVLPETDKKGRFYVPFTGEPGAFYDEISLADLIAGEVPADYYAGKIVLIGPYAAGLQDAVVTPIDRAKQMYGVEFQANVIEALLNGNYKHEVSDLVQALILLLVCFGLFMLFYNMKVLHFSLLSLAAILLSSAGSVLLYDKGYILHPLWLPVGVLAIYLLSIGHHYIVARAEKQKITRTFERYVDPEIVGEILKEGTESLSLGGKLCDIAVLFVDIRGFTTMSERLSPTEVVAVLNKYLDMTSNCISRYKGTLDKFIGDATMAFWGAPLPQEDAVYHAVLAALAIIQGAEEISEEVKEITGEELHVGVGVHYGPAVVGNIGAQRRMDFTAIGDTVNTAARLEANAPGGKVYISRNVADQLQGRIRVTSLGNTVRLKGKSDGFEVLLLDGLTEE